MTGTIVSSLTCAIENGNFKDDPNVETVSIVQSALGGGNPGTVTITTSEGDITIGLTAPGFIIIENMDDTHYFEYGPKSGGAMVVFAKCLPGAFHVLYLAASVTIRAKANTASVQARIRSYEA